MYNPTLQFGYFAGNRSNLIDWQAILCWVKRESSEYGWERDTMCKLVFQLDFLVWGHPAAFDTEINNISRSTKKKKKNTLIYLVVALSRE